MWFFIGLCAAVSVCARICRMRVRDHKIMINNDREDARRTRICTLWLYIYIYIYENKRKKKIKYTYRRERWKKNVYNHNNNIIIIMKIDWSGGLWRSIPVAGPRPAAPCLIAEQCSSLSSCCVYQLLLRQYVRVHVCRPVTDGQSTSSRGRCYYYWNPPLYNT